MKIICLCFVLTLSCAVASEAVTYTTFSLNQTNSTNHTAEENEKHPEGVVLVEIRYEAIKEPFFLTLVVLIAGLSKIGKEVHFFTNYLLHYIPLYQEASKSIIINICNLFIHNRNMDISLREMLATSIR